MWDSVGSFIIAVATSTVVAQALSQLMTGAREQGKLSREARASALLAAVGLEVFADECLQIYEGRRDLDRRGRGNVNFQGLPAEPKFDDKIDWTAVDSSLADDALTFGHVVRKRTKGIASKKEWSDVHTDKKEMSEDLKDRALELTRTALDLAEQMRVKHGLRPRDQQESWEVPARLESYEAEERRRAKKERDERDREHAAIESGQR